MTGPAIKYYRVLVPAKDGLEKLNELGAAGHMLAHMDRRTDGTLSLVMVMPRDWDKEPWCPPEIARQIAKLQSRMRRTLDESSKDRDVPVPRAQLEIWIKWIDEIMNPNPEPEMPE